MAMASRPSQGHEDICVQKGRGDARGLAPKPTPNWTARQCISNNEPKTKAKDGSSRKIRRLGWSGGSIVDQTQVPDEPGTKHT